MPGLLVSKLSSPRVPSTQVLPRDAYERLFASMYTTLVPTSGDIEAAEVATWDYRVDAGSLPPDLSRIGIPLGTFFASLFAVADNVRVVAFCVVFVRGAMREQDLVARAG